MLLKLWDARTGRILFTALTFLLVLAFLHGARETITLYLFAIFFAYLVDPIVSRFQKLLRGRGKAILVFYILFVGVVVGLGFLLGPRVAEEGRSLIVSLPTLLDRMASGQFVVDLAHNEGWDQASQHHIQQFFMSHRNEILNYAEGIAEGLRTPLYHVWWLILIPILSIFFLKSGSHIVKSIVNLRRDGHESTELKRIIADIHSMLGNYIRAQLILACLTAIALTLVLWLMRVPYSLNAKRQSIRPLYTIEQPRLQDRPIVTSANIELPFRLSVSNDIPRSSIIRRRKPCSYRPEMQRTRAFDSLFTDYTGSAFAVHLWDGWCWHSSQDGQPECTIRFTNPSALELLVAKALAWWLGY